MDSVLEHGDISVSYRQKPFVEHLVHNNPLNSDLGQNYFAVWEIKTSQCLSTGTIHDTCCAKFLQMHERKWYW